MTLSEIIGKLDDEHDILETLFDAITSETSDVPDHVSNTLGACASRIDELVKALMSANKQATRAEAVTAPAERKAVRK